MKIETSGGFHVGEQGEIVEEQDQAGALPEVGRCCTSAEEASGLGEEFVREGRTMKWRRARQETTPRAVGGVCFSEDAPIIGRQQRSVTRALFVKWSTKFEMTGGFLHSEGGHR
jgi:hypothetical protein